MARFHSPTLAVLLTMTSGLVLPVQAQEVVNIGIIQPLSGPNAQFGTNALHGSEMVVEAINAAGGIKSMGGAKVQLVVADVPSPNAAPAATQRLVSQNEVAGVVGAFISSITLSASEITERAGVPLITFAFADQITERGYDYVFQVTPKGSTFGKDQLGYTVAIGEAAGTEIDKIAILYEDTAYGTAQAAGLRAEAEARGIEIVMDEAYPLGITDASALVNKLRASDAEVVFPVSYLNDSLLIIRTMRQQGLTIPAIGGAAGYVIPNFKEGLGDLAENTLSVASAAGDAIPEISAAYKQKYGSFMTHEAVAFAAATDAMIQAIEIAGTDDPDAVRDALDALEYCEGFAKGMPGGCINFDENGHNSVTYPIMVQWRGDEPVTVYPPSDATTDPIWTLEPTQ